MEIKVPQLGRSMQSPTLVEWRAQEGDQVEQGSPILVIESEKIRNDLEAEGSGFLHILVAEGSQAEVGSTVGFIVKTKEELAALPEKPSAKQPSAAKPEEAPRDEAALVSATPPAGARVEEGGRIRISPVARKLAEENMVDISGVTGTGPGGRIIREDIEKAMQAKPAAAAPVSAADEGRVKETIPLTGMRGAIAEHMHRSLAISAQVTIMGEIDMDQAVKLRNNLVAQESVIGSRISYTAIFVQAVARALKENPMVNSSIVDNDIKVWGDINIGVAIALEKGLAVPVIKSADGKSLAEIDQAMKGLTQKAREGKLDADDMSDGTFTVSNIGAVGVGYRFSTVIINQPESAILGMGSITDRPQVRDGQIVIRPVMTYSLTYDHRSIDGAVAARFMGAIIRMLENPYLLLV
ncbi:dihydrolipoamide acetyltransferase family protein [Chloroflexota bacterium]